MLRSFNPDFLFKDIDGSSVDMWSVGGVEMVLNWLKVRPAGQLDHSLIFEAAPAKSANAHRLN
jgi:hypothetical protein